MVDVAEPVGAGTATAELAVPEAPGARANAGPVGSEVTERVFDAALVLVARWGVSKTTLADIAREAGCARATVYRAFPGGKQHLFQALAARELAAYLAAIIDAIDEADDLEDALTRALVVASRLLADHDAAQFVLDHEPELLVPFLSFKHVDVLYGHTTATVGPHLERFLPAARAGWTAEWAARLFISYLFNPDPEIDLGHIAGARALVARYLLPAFRTTTHPPSAPHRSKGATP